MRQKAFLVAAGIFSAPLLFAQSVEEGKKMLYYERYESAKELFKKELSTNKLNAEAYYYLTQTFLADGEKNSADSLLKTVPQELAADALVKVTQGQLLLLNGNNADATKLFDEALASAKKKEAGELMIKVARAHVDAKTGDANYAVQLLIDAEKKEKKNVDLYMVRGDAYRKQADGGEAMKAYLAALEQNSKYAKAKYLIGRIFLSQDNKEIYLQNFKEAVELDPAFAPALYELYYYYYFRDVNTSRDYLDKYIAVSDASAEHDYMIADLLFVSRKYDEALEKAKGIIASQGPKAEPRLYKLIAYSYDAKADSAKAKDFMTQYFAKQAADKLVAKDHDFMGTILQKFPGEEMNAAASIEKAVALDTAVTAKVEYMTKLAAIYKKLDNRSKEAYWLGQCYCSQKDPSNTELFNWGMAHFFAKEYAQADSVFGVYSVKYPDQVYGYYWRARSNAAIDTAMDKGMAVPHYTKLIEIAAADAEKNKSLLIQSHGYLAAYSANTLKDYAKAVEHLDSVLVLAPENADAKANKDVLQKLVNKGVKPVPAETTNKETNSGGAGAGSSTNSK